MEYRDRIVTVRHERPGTAEPTMTNDSRPDLPEDATLLLVDDDTPFLNRLARAMTARPARLPDALLETFPPCMRPGRMPVPSC